MASNRKTDIRRVPAMINGEPRFVAQLIQTTGYGGRQVVREFVLGKKGGCVQEAQRFFTIRTKSGRAKAGFETM